MNAYELADFIDKYCEDNTSKEAAVLLRQQAERLAELEKFNKAILKKGGYPHKPLSIEEIEGVFYKKCWYYDEDEKFDYYGFARAIEERHGIK